MAKEKITTNANGERIHHRADGEKCIARDQPSATHARILAASPERRERHAQLVQVKHDRVAAKKARQARKGWPSDKSPV